MTDTASFWAASWVLRISEASTERVGLLPCQTWPKKPSGGPKAGSFSPVHAS
jgi:hypothetical protein